MDFVEMVNRATGHPPYPYQSRLADDGLPDLLEVPTGAGKTLAATLPWLYRRRFHPDAAVRVATPHWLVFALPMRVLVEQTAGAISEWLDRLELDGQVRLYTVMGGEGRIESDWRMHPEQDAVFVGTIDMLLSRALNRGYGESRFAWPIDFGLLNSGTQWVFDEVQLMGAALPTSRQLDGLRRALGHVGAVGSMWMSATVRHADLETVDAPMVEQTVELSPEDRTGPLARRLGATKEVGELLLDGKSYERSVAEQLLAHHRPGTLTLAMLNTVDRAVAIYRQMQKVGTAAELQLVHSRFRPPERQSKVEAVVRDVDRAGPGRIVVSTQVLEAGVDISAATLFTEASPWPSVVQRAGRCNRTGDEPRAQLLWTVPPKALPYEQDDVAASVDVLRSLQGSTVTPGTIGDLEVEQSRTIHPVLRRRDLLELFDTSPDLSGNDIDVSRFIRSTDDSDAAVAWMSLEGEPPDRRSGLPLRAERCPVPIGQLRDPKVGVGSRRAFRFDHLAEGWVRCDRADVRPGMVVVLDAEEGGYDADVGWNAMSREPVELMQPTDESDVVTDDDLAAGDDPLSEQRQRWLALTRHLEDVEQEVRDLVSMLDVSGLSASVMQAAVEAGRLHDLGKVHPAFQGMLESCAQDDDEREAMRRAGSPLAKSGGRFRGRNERRYFRHELASALALLGEGARAIDPNADAGLIVYLVAAHHGRIRLGFRSLPDEKPPPGFDRDTPVALGICHLERLPAVQVPRAEVPSSTMDLNVMGLGSANGVRSWSDRALEIRDRDDLGPFRLGFLEALVRVADWRASAAADERED
ncbi:MAG: CRISPR-associated helicase Cas3' [Actinobacteria bacterium]|nr:CRISPR-associated helicase Cas3' [Actinomycetota bacterium]